MHLFAGAGGGLLADILLGHQPVCAVEINSHCQQVLAARQKEGCLPFFPIFADVKKFDGRPWHGLVDILAGGFPCTNLSISGDGTGLDGPESGLWVEQKRIIREVGPKSVFVENSPMLTTRGLGIILGDLADLGFDVEWGVLGANATGLDHCRERIWIVGHSNRDGWQGQSITRNRKETPIEVIQRRALAGTNDTEGLAAWRRTQPGIQRVVDGVAVAVERHRAIGNGQVPRLAATAWQLLSPNN